MITEEEFENIQVGDYIEVVSEWNGDTNEAPVLMDYLLSRTFEVTEKATKTTVKKGIVDNFQIVRQSDDIFVWSLNLHCIAKVIKRTENLKSIDDDLLERMLEI